VCYRKYSYILVCVFVCVNCTARYSFFSEYALIKFILFQMTNVGWLVLSFNGNKYRGR
jgi:hypothetical protein